MVRTESGSPKCASSNHTLLVASRERYDYGQQRRGGTNAHPEHTSSEVLYCRVAVNVPSTTDGIVTLPARVSLSAVPAYRTFEGLPSSNVSMKVNENVVPFTLPVRSA